MQDLAGQIKSLQAQHNHNLGALDTVKRSIEEASKQLDNPNFKGIDQLYKQRKIEVDTTEKAAGDLEKYHKVRLPKALWCLAWQRSMCGMHTVVSVIVLSVFFST